MTHILDKTITNMLQGENYLYSDSGVATANMKRV